MDAALRQFVENARQSAQKCVIPFIFASVHAGCRRDRVPAAGIHLREKNIAGLPERSRRAVSRPVQARREGPAFFDEDGVCRRFETLRQPA